MGDVLEFRRRQVLADIRFLQARLRLLPCHRDEIVQLQHTACTGFERLAVRAVHRAEANMLERSRRDPSGDLRRPKDLREVVRLPLVDDVKIEVGIDFALALNDGREIRGAVHRGPFGGDHEQRRNRPLVVLASDAHDLRILTQLQEILFSQLIQHAGDEGIGVALAVPQIEIDAERAELALQCSHGQIVHGSPDAPMERLAFLQRQRRFARP